MWISEPNTLSKKEIKKISRLEKEYERYVCPISQQLMREPCDVCGFFYDRDHIVEWLSKNKSLPIPSSAVQQQTSATSSGLAAGESIEPPSPQQPSSNEKVAADAAKASSSNSSPPSPVLLAAPQIPNISQIIVNVPRRDEIREFTERFLRKSFKYVQRFLSENRDLETALQLLDTCKEIDEKNITVAELEVSIRDALDAGADVRGRKRARRVLADLLLERIDTSEEARDRAVQVLQELKDLFLLAPHASSVVAAAAAAPLSPAPSLAESTMQLASSPTSSSFMTSSISSLPPLAPSVIKSEEDKQAIINIYRDLLRVNIAAGDIDTAFANLSAFSSWCADNGKISAKRELLMKYIDVIGQEHARDLNEMLALMEERDAKDRRAAAPLWQRVATFHQLAFNATGEQYHWNQAVNALKRAIKLDPSAMFELQNALWDLYWQAGEGFVESKQVVAEEMRELNTLVCDEIRKFQERQLQTVRIEARLSQGEYELGEVQCEPVSTIVEVSLVKPDTQGQGKVSSSSSSSKAPQSFSAKFKLMGLEWKIKLYPEGDKRQPQPQSNGLFLSCVTSEANRLEVVAGYQLRARDLLGQDSVEIIQSTERVFSDNSWGSLSLIHQQTFNERYVDHAAQVCRFRVTVTLKAVRRKPLPAIGGSTPIIVSSSSNSSSSK